MNGVAEEENINIKKIIEKIVCDHLGWSDLLLLLASVSLAIILTVAQFCICLGYYCLSGTCLSKYSLDTGGK